ncbi:MAG: hypothetical protein F4W92_05745 [Gammaproteobacteria bacterium]|nr:hypothetical protein [Gammaproteobacteria bacterium]
MKVTKFITFPIFAYLVVLLLHGCGNTEGWEIVKVTDKFTDDSLNFAFATTKLDKHTVGLFVTCYEGGLSISLGGGLNDSLQGFVDPLAIDSDSLNRTEHGTIAVPFRLDQHEPQVLHFGEYDGVLGLESDPYLMESIVQIYTDIKSDNESDIDFRRLYEATGNLVVPPLTRKMYNKLFVKQLSTASRLRVRLNQRTLEFSLAGAKNTLLQLVSGCNVSFSEISKLEEITEANLIELLNNISGSELSDALYKRNKPEITGIIKSKEFLDFVRSKKSADVANLVQMLHHFKSEGFSHAFTNGEGIVYGSLIELLEDESWIDRYEFWQ